jgi:CRP/FNR family transcriptional regulator
MNTQDITLQAATTMSSSSAAFGLPTRIEDLLAQLPVSASTGYRKGHMIYGPTTSSKNIYLVVSGTVGISQVSEDGREVLLELVRPDELFGELAFLDAPQRSDRATAIERVTLMAWAVSDMEALIAKRPRLAVALLQVLAQRNAEFTRRIESFSRDSVERRLARTLLRFSKRLGTLGDGGTVRMMPLTHEILARYVGTSREVVTHHMNRLRKQGYVSYSRQGILLYRDCVEASLSGRGVPSPVASS